METDLLTRLKNLVFFNKRLASGFEEAVRSGKPLSVIMVDLDRFKEINDHFGHDVGDLALQRFADAMQMAVGDAGDACRLGGDEFVILLPGSGMKNARAIAKKVRDNVRSAQLTIEHQGGHRTIHLASSQGICTLNDSQAKTGAQAGRVQFGGAQMDTFQATVSPVGSAEEMLKVADARMYEAKNRSKAQHPSIRHQIEGGYVRFSGTLA